MKSTNDDSRIIHDLGELIQASVEMTGRLLRIESEVKSRLRGTPDEQNEPRALYDVFDHNRVTPEDCQFLRDINRRDDSPDEDRYGLPTATREEWLEGHQEKKENL